MRPALDVMIPFHSLGKSGVVFLHGGQADLACLDPKSALLDIGSLSARGML